MVGRPAETALLLGLTRVGVVLAGSLLIVLVIVVPMVFKP